MYKLICLSLLISLLTACGGNNSKNDADSGSGTNTDSTNQIKGSNLEERFRNEIAPKMGIPASEHYTLHVKYEHLNGDDVKDAVITLNRLEYAKKDAAESPKGMNKKTYGFMGNYNFFFVYDGQSDRISVPVNIASSALSPLRIKFENIQSEAYKDIVIEYRIRNSSYNNYYLYQDGQVSLMFQWKNFDLVGTNDYEANYIRFDKGSYSLAKDILIYKGKIKDYSTNIPDIYAYEPLIEKDGGLQYRFFYDPKGMKYMTTQQPGEPLTEK